MLSSNSKYPVFQSQSARKRQQGTPEHMSETIVAFGEKHRKFRDNTLIFEVLNGMVHCVSLSP